MIKPAFAPAIVLLFSACQGNTEPATQQMPAKKPAPFAQAVVVARPAATDTIVYSNDSLQYLARVSFELLTYRSTSDTLQLVSTSEFLFYPFGRLTTVAAFQRKHPVLTFTQEPDSVDASAKLYRGMFKNGFVKLFADPEKKALEVVSGRLSSPEIRLTNGVKVGMTKRDFFIIFFKKPTTLEKGTANIIELISGLDGIRHYYIFRNNTLQNIIFDTDYQFSKL